MTESQEHLTETKLYKVALTGKFIIYVAADSWQRALQIVEMHNENLSSPGVLKSIECVSGFLYIAHDERCQAPCEEVYRD